jgi:hypothetical protein
MDEPVYLDEMEATSRDGWSELRGQPFGPAGTSVVELPDGTVLEVDHADPGRLVSLAVDGDLERSSLVRDLLGPERFDWTCAQLDAQRAAKPLGKRLRAQVPGSQGQWAQSIPRITGRSGPAGELGAAVLAADMSADESLSPLLRLAAGLEFLDAAEDPAMSSVLGPAADQIEGELFRVARLVEPEDFSGFGNRAVKPLYRFSSLLAAARRARPSLDMQLRRVADLVDLHLGGGQLPGNAGGLVGRPPVARSASLRATRYMSQGDMSLAAFSMDFAEADAAPPPEDFLEVDVPVAGSVVVRVSRQHDGKWVRILRTSGLVPLALVPLEENGMLLEALAVVPPDLVVDDLLVEVLDPHGAVVPERPLALVRGAVEAGRVAAHYERLHRLKDASVAWRECGRLWAEAGDSRRAQSAAERASAPGGVRWSPGVDALVVDELLAVSEGERPGWK